MGGVVFFFYRPAGPTTCVPGNMVMSRSVRTIELGSVTTRMRHKILTERLDLPKPHSAQFSLLFTFLVTIR